MDSENYFTRSHVVDFFSHHYMSIVTTLFAVIFPLLLAFIFLLCMGNNWFHFDVLQNINGNNYLTNNILITFTLAGYLIIEFSLYFYNKDILLDAIKYKGKNSKVEKLLLRASKLVRITGVLVGIYALVIILGMTGWKWINFRFIIDLNKAITITCFLFFIWVDYLIITSKNIEKHELRNLPATLDHQGRFINKISHYENEVDLSTWSAFLISLPTVFVTLIIWWLLYYISGHSNNFHVVHDATTPNNFSKIAVDWDMFDDGIETGMIAASVVLSQIIFAVLKLRFHFRTYVIDIKFPPPLEK